MDPVIIAAITIGLLLILILFGMHVGVAMAACSAVGLWWIKGDLMIALKILGTTSFRSVMEYVFGVVPMFIIMGMFANLSGASEDLYDSANVLLGKVRGGLGHATVVANAIFAAITGVSVASAAVFSKIALPQMRRHGYDHKFALGTVAGSSALGMLIPPSVLLIIYGLLTEEAIGKLFMAGVLPGLLLASVYCIGIYLMVLVKPRLGGDRVVNRDQDLGFKEFWRALTKPWMFVVLIVMVLGGIYLGWFTPTEAGAVGAFGAFVLALIRGRVNIKSLWNVLLESGHTTASVFLLLITSQMYARMLTISGLPSATSEWVMTFSLPPLVIVFVFLFVFIILGAIMDSVSMLLVCIPLMLPILKALNLDIIWFGVIAVVAIEMGFFTPPFGLVVFAMKAAIGDEASVEDIFVGSFPFLVMIFVVLLILVFVPALSTWFPSLM
ncbi:MAG: TRAP transporter large permease [Thermodesulfobacteriota bacterium]|nr:TRAP transporter large permease [Thermodesulfobacteriota bacterium]